MNKQDNKNVKRKFIRDGLFYQPTSPDEKPHLIGTKCRVCGYSAFPKRPVCPWCLKEGTMDEVALSSRGRINSFTIARVAPLGFKAPYIAAFIDLPEGPRLFSIITGCEPSEEALDIGKEAELLIDKIGDDEEGNELIGYMFRPV